MTHNSSVEDARQMLIPKCKTADQLLAILGPKNPYLLYIWLSMALVWALAAMPMMSSAFLMDEGCMKMQQQNASRAECIPQNGTVTAEFHLNASKDGFLVDMTTSAFVAGMGIGSIIMPIFTDLLGRRPVLLAVLLIGGVGGCLSALSPNIFVFILLRFVQGLSFSGTCLTNWVLAYESIPMELRSQSALVFGLMWVVGYCLIAPMAYFAPNWRLLITMVSAPSLFFAIVYYFTVPESLHYLVSRKRTKCVAKWFKNADKFAECFKTGKIDSAELKLFLDHIDQEVIRKTSQQQIEQMIRMERTFIEKLRDNHLLLKFVAIFTYLWICDGFIYYGLSLFSTKLAGDRYINFTLIALVEVPSYVFSPPLLDRMGRRLFTVFMHLLVALAFLGTVFFRHDSATVLLLLWLLAKYGIASSFTGLFVYASELFPTVNRSICMGFATTMSQLLCTLLAPGIRIMSGVSPILPMIFFCSCALIGTFITFLLPESKGKELPDRLSVHNV